MINTHMVKTWREMVEAVGMQLERLLLVSLRIWQEFVSSLSTLGGSLLLLTFILFAFYPLLVREAQAAEAWKAAMFVLGAITGIINNGVRTAKLEPPPSESKKDTDPKQGS
jgi:hypothetical protein